MKERRQVRRRTMPFLRGGVLQVGEREHIVTIVDLSPEGAFLATRVDVRAGKDVALRAVLPRGGRQVTLPCEVVWRNARFDPKTGRPAGMAVRFIGPDDQVRRHLDGLSLEGLYPAAITGTRHRYEYRIIETSDVDVSELNRLGHDGWALATTIPREHGTRLVLYRRL
jgi:hypothetical protein